MGCGGSKEDVATGAGRGSKLFRRKSTISASRRASSSSGPDDTSVAVKDVVKEPAAGEPKADVEVASAEKPVAVIVEEKKEEVVVKKDVTDSVAATVTEEPAATEQPPTKEEEEELPRSTMTDEAVVEEAAKVNEAVVLKEETCKAEETSPAPTYEDGESVGQSTTEPMEAKPFDKHKAEEAAAVSELSPEENADEQTATAAAAQSG